ncbi:MAG: hypothetical protein R3F43_20060 [bacterium]
MAKDLRALGELLYLALAGLPAPGRSLDDPAEPGSAIPVEFGDLADAWGRSGRSGAGRAIFGALGARALTTRWTPSSTAAARVLAAHRGALAEVAWLSADRLSSKAEVERQRDRQRSSKQAALHPRLAARQRAAIRGGGRSRGRAGGPGAQPAQPAGRSVLLDRPIRPGPRRWRGTARAEVRAPERPAPAAVADEPDDEPVEAAPVAAVDEPAPPAAPGAWGACWSWPWPRRRWPAWGSGSRCAPRDPVPRRPCRPPSRRSCRPSRPRRRRPSPARPPRASPRSRPLRRRRLPP